MFHRLICRCLVMLFGVPLSLLGHDDGTSLPRGKISFAYWQIKHSFNYTLLNRPQLKYFLGFRELSGHSRWNSSKYFGAEFEES